MCSGGPVVRNRDGWRETKYVRTALGLRASRDPREVAVGSRLVADLVAMSYSSSLPLHASGVLLDLGCGKVPLYDAYRSLVDHVVCVDWPGSFHTNEHVDVHCDLTRPLPLGSAIADTLIFSDVLEHLPDPQLAFAEMARVLRPGGKLLLNTPFLYRVHEAPHDYLRHTRYSLIRLAEGSGFEVLEIEELGSALHVLLDIVAKLAAEVPLVGARISSSVQAVGARFARTRLGSRLRARTAGSFPLAHMLVAVRTTQATPATDGQSVHSSAASPIPR